MASNALYISVLSPAITSGTVSVHVYTRDLAPTNTNPPSPNLTGSAGLPEGLNEPASADFTVTISLTGAETEEQIADLILNNLATYMLNNGLNYQGWLAYAEEMYPATFRVTRTDHSVCIWSQALFNVEVSTNTDAYIAIGKHPALNTIADFVGDIFYSENNLTSNQVAQLIISASAYLCNRIK